MKVIQIQHNFASTNLHRYQLPSKNVFRENVRSGLPIVSRAESDENLKFDRVMHKTQDGKTPSMLPSRSSETEPQEESQVGIRQDQRIIFAARDRVYFLPLGLPAGLLPFAAGLLPLAAGAAAPLAAGALPPGAPPANALP